MTQPKPAILAYTLSLTVVWVTAGCGSTADSAPEAEVAVAAATRASITGSCSIQASDGHYLSAVDGGGRVDNPVRSDATRVDAWERFSFVEMHDGSPIAHYALQTSDGHYLTIVDGGGRTTDVVHADTSEAFGWEKVALIALAGDYVAIQTWNGHFLSAAGGGGRAEDAIHSDATRIDETEKFKLVCQ